MITPWVENEDDTLSCTACGAERFRRGHSCLCSAAGFSGDLTPESSPSLSASASADCSSGELVAEPLPSADAYERDLQTTLRALRRLRAAINRAPVEDEYVKSDDGRRGTWRQAWQAEHSKLGLRIKALEVERKVVESLHGHAVKREEPELVGRMEKAVSTLRRRKGRLSREPGVQ